MNELKKCSIAGISFSLERDAYDRLDGYLKSLHKAYNENPDGKEIVADIEARVAELILSALSDHNQTVALPLVENIISQLGDASDISGEQGAEEPKPAEPVITHRLYRDTANGRMGGVLAGLAKYFDIDPVWLRLAMFLPLLVAIFGNQVWWLSQWAGNIFGVLVMSYIIMWFVIPQAKSARQKLEMSGEPVTVKNIEQQSAATPEQKARASVASAVTVFGRIVVILLKVFAVFMLFPLVSVVLALVVAAIAIVVNIDPVLVLMNDMNINLLGMSGGAYLPLLGILIVLVPAVYLLYVFIALLLDKRPSWKAALVCFILWVLLLIGTAVVGVSATQDMSRDEVSRIMKKVHTEIADEVEYDELDINSAQVQQLLADPSAPSIDGE